MSDSGRRGPVNEQIKDIYQPDDLARWIDHRIMVKSGASRKLGELFDGCLPTDRHNFRKTDHDVFHFHRTKIDHIMNHSSLDAAQHPHPLNLACNIFQILSSYEDFARTLEPEDTFGKQRSNINCRC